MKKDQNKSTETLTSTRSKRKGFSAVEALIGATLMAGLIAGMLHLLKQSNYLVELARDHSRVTQILQSEIEDLRTLNWTDLTSLESFETVTPQGRFVSEYANEYYCYRYVIDSYDNPTEKKWVWIMASWKDSMNRTHWIYQFTQFSKDGLNDYL